MIHTILRLDEPADSNSTLQFTHHTHTFSELISNLVSHVIFVCLISICVIQLFVTITFHSILMLAMSDSGIECHFYRWEEKVDVRKIVPLSSLLSFSFLPTHTKCQYHVIRLVTSVSAVHVQKLETDKYDWRLVSSFVLSFVSLVTLEGRSLLRFECRECSKKTNKESFLLLDRLK